MAVSLSIHASKFWPKVKAQTRGVTLIELLLVIAILALLFLAVLFAVRLQLSHSRDAQRKAHLEKLRVVFENYYNDKGCYPPVDIFFNGGTKPDPSLCGLPLAQLQPYLDKVPCDPETQLPYAYYSPNGKTICQGYRLYTKLEDSSDTGVSKVGCSKTGCGSLSQYNYGVSIGANLADTGTVAPSPTPAQYGAPSPDPTGFNGNWVCSPDADMSHGNRPYCKEYNPVAGHGCGASFATVTICDMYCHLGSSIVCAD